MIMYQWFVYLGLSFFFLQELIILFFFDQTFCGQNIICCVVAWGSTTLAKRFSKCRMFFGRHKFMFFRGFMKDFHSIVHNYSCPEMKRLLIHSMSDTKRWGNTIFFKHAHDNISYFSTYTSDGNLLNIPSKTIFHRKLQNAMFNELTS